MGDSDSGPKQRDSGPKQREQSFLMLFQVNQRFIQLEQICEADSYAGHDLCGGENQPTAYPLRM